MAARISGTIRIEDEVPEKLKHLSAHAAMDVQSSMALHGMAAGGQQSCIGSEIDISVDARAAAPAVIGSIATDTAMKTANMVRPMFILNPGM